MLDKDFIDIKYQLEKVKGMMETSLENYKRVGFENNKLYNKLQYDFENIEDMIRCIDYLNKDTVEGTLILRADGRYEIADSNYTAYLTSGSSIELYIDSEWHLGRIESKQGDNPIYYFLDDYGANISLYEGLRVRVRKDY